MKTHPYKYSFRDFPRPPSPLARVSFKMTAIYDSAGVAVNLCKKTFNKKKFNVKPISTLYEVTYDINNLKKVGSNVFWVDLYKTL